MKKMGSLMRNRFRQTVMSAFALSCILPLLIVIYVLYVYIEPRLAPGVIENLKPIIGLALLGMLAIPALGFFLLSWWMKSLEKLTEEVRSKTAELIEDKTAPTAQQDNEMLTLRHHFNGLYNELQDKIKQLNEYSHQLIDTNIRLSELAVTDDLTTLYNRRYFDERLVEEVARSERHGFDLSLIMLDIDGFKQYNDSRGHQIGDELLQNIGLLIRSSIRRSDIPFRYGGDEFAVLLPQCGLKDAARVAQKIVRAVNVQRFGAEKEGGDGDRFISVSCGVAVCKRGLNNLVSDADKCLYKAKTSGKGRVVFAQASGKEAAQVVADQVEGG
jgi:diguanylate cyclase (GGDEF)-like protein